LLAELGKSKFGQLKITLKDEMPVTYHPYRLSHSDRERVRQQIAKLGFEFTMGQSDPVSQEDGDLRMCNDYRKLNKRMVPDKYLLPRINDLLDQLTGMKYFTTLDMASGYHQIAVAPELRPVTAFVTPDHH